MTEKNTKKTSKTSRTTKAPKAKGGIKKQYVKSKSLCKVTFKLPKEAAPDARTVNVVGDFNRWSREDTPMKRLKNGDFTATVELESGREYIFKYLIDDVNWENDWNADRYEPNVYGTEDSVVVT